MLDGVDKLFVRRWLASLVQGDSFAAAHLSTLARIAFRPQGEKYCPLAIYLLRTRSHRSLIDPALQSAHHVFLAER
jgi:hypothetical protein